jgi:serine/threonine-protein kinase HipA
MSAIEIYLCPGTLAEGFNSYSPACLKNLFNGKKVSHLLPFDPPEKDDAVAEMFIENRKHISISGIQEKVSMVLEKNQLHLTEERKQGTYILKPVPRDLKNVDQVPANEHLTMQIARQVYGIRTAENAMIFFRDGSPAYLTKRFDIRSDNSKWGIEDFASLSGRSVDNEGPDFKYHSSYEEIGLIIHQFVPAWRIEIERYFALVIFNYIFSNGDAHLKNFSLLETRDGDYILSPAYDLINTRIHLNDADFALESGLFKDDYKSDQFKKSGHANMADFYEFGFRIGIPDQRIKNLMEPFKKRQKKVERLIERSFLNESTKEAYHLMYNTRRNFLIS